MHVQDVIIWWYFTIKSERISLFTSVMKIRDQMVRNDRENHLQTYL